MTLAANELDRVRQALSDERPADPAAERPRRRSDAVIVRVASRRRRIERRDAPNGAHDPKPRFMAPRPHRRGPVPGARGCASAAAGAVLDRDGAAHPRAGRAAGVQDKRGALSRDLLRRARGAGRRGARPSPVRRRADAARRRARPEAVSRSRSARRAGISSPRSSPASATSCFAKLAAAAGHGRRARPQVRLRAHRHPGRCAVRHDRQRAPDPRLGHGDAIPGPARRASSWSAIRRARPTSSRRSSTIPRSARASPRSSASPAPSAARRSPTTPSSTRPTCCSTSPARPAMPATAAAWRACARPCAAPGWRRTRCPPSVPLVLARRPCRRRSASRRSCKAAHRKLAQIDGRNDSQMIFYDQIIPGSTLLGYVNADHWAIVVPIARVARHGRRAVRHAERLSARSADGGHASLHRRRPRGARQVSATRSNRR